MNKKENHGNGNQVAGTKEVMKSVLNAVINAKSEVVDFLINAEEKKQYSLIIPLDGDSLTAKHLLKVECFNEYKNVSYDIIGENGQVMLSASGDNRDSDNAYHTLIGRLYMKTI